MSNRLALTPRIWEVYWEGDRANDPVRSIGSGGAARKGASRERPRPGAVPAGDEDRGRWSLRGYLPGGDPEGISDSAPRAAARGHGWSRRDPAPRRGDG